METDYRALLNRQDLYWQTKPQSIFDGPFTGNGSTGINLYFNKNDNLYMNIGNTGIYDNRTPEPEMTYRERENLFLTPRLALGGFEFVADKEVTSSRMRMSLYDGVLTARLGGKGCSSEVCAYTVEGEEAVVFSWCENGLSLTPVYSPCEAISPRQHMMLILGEEKRRSFHYAEAKQPYEVKENGAVAFIQPKFNGGAYCITYKTFAVDNKKTLVVVISDDDKPAFDSVERIYNNLDSVREKHDSFWHGFYTTSSLTLDDEQIEQFYWIQLYKCACATRSGKRIYDTAGPWLDRLTAWPGAWWNLNIELHYSLLYPSNHLEIASSLPEAIQNNLETFRNNVPEKYRNGRYITVGRNTTATFETPCGIPGEETKEIELELGNILWALHNCYVHYSSDADDEALSGCFFENLKNATDYILNFLVEKKDGKLHLLPTTSPEYPGISEDCNYTLSLLHWALGVLVKLNEKYGINDAEAEMWRKILKKLAYFSYDKKEGFMIGADKPYGMSHRHYSHLLMIYPLHLLDENDPKDREKMVKSIEFWHSKPEALLGYSQSGAASMFALLGDGNRAYSHIMNLFKGFICPNTMYNEDSNPVLETPPAAARSVLDMIMYSYGDEIRVFDAVPDRWKRINYKDLLAENGCKVSAEMTDGKTKCIEITAKKARFVKLKAHFDGEIDSTVTYEYKGGYYYFNIGAGETAVFRTVCEN